MDKIIPKNISKKRFVAMLDILGFKERVKEKDHQTIYSELHALKSLLDESEITTSYLDKSTNEKQNRISHILFSDTIVLITNDTSESDFTFLLVYAKIIIQYCLKNVIPIKGCIAEGNISFNKTQQIIFGRSIIDAHLLAEEMKFMGIIFDKSVHNTIKHFNNPSPLILKEKVPLKSGNITHYYLNIKGGSSTKSISINNEDILSGIEQMYFDANAAPRIYFDNTLELFGKMS